MTLWRHRLQGRPAKCDHRTMFPPLALPGEGFHFEWVKTALFICATLLLCTPTLAQGQDADPAPEQSDPIIDDLPRFVPPEGPFVLPPDSLPDSLPDPLRDPLLPPGAADLPPPDESVPEAPIPNVEAPDYSRLSSDAERAARLDDMFSRLAEAEEADAGNLIAEEIWAVWLSSGSASVDFVMRRGAAAQTRSDNDRARLMFDHVTRLEPNYAEGWARSSRLALEERDFARAASEALRTLTLEPRHFYALWTLGNVLERLGRNSDALEAYREANRLYPSLETVSDRVEALELQLQGGVL